MNKETKLIQADIVRANYIWRARAAAISRRSSDREIAIVELTRRLVKEFDTKIQCGKHPEITQMLFAFSLGRIDFKLLAENLLIGVNP